MANVPRKFDQLTYTPGFSHAWTASCILCRWWGRFRIRNEALRASRRHHCARTLPQPASHPMPQWWHLAACQDVEVEIFFTPATEAEALAICNRCPVVASCLRSTLREERAEGFRHGVRGGTLPEEREAFRA